MTNTGFGGSPDFTGPLSYPRGPQRTCRSKEDAVLSTVAHELMHGVQRTFPGFMANRKNLWFIEATATWEESHYDKNSNCEHTRAFSFFDRPNISLDYDPFLAEDLRRYEAYLWPFYLELKTGGAAVLKSIFEKLAGMSAHGAINSSIAGGYRERFPEFALYNFNEEGFAKNYRFDQIKLGARTSEPTSGRVVPVSESLIPFETFVSMKGKGALDFDLSYSIPNLSAVYYQFYFPDPEARWVLLEHYLIVPDTPGRLQVIYQIAGDTSWHQRDLTAEKLPYLVFCRDQKDERVEKLVVIISNSEWTSAGDGKTLDQIIKLPEPPRLVVRNVGCWRWEGEVRATLNADGFANQTTTLFKSRVAFEPVNPEDPTKKDPLQRDFRVVSHDTEWSLAGTLIGVCTGSGRGTMATLDDSFSNLWIEYKTREYSGSGVWPPDLTGPTVPFTCNPGDITLDVPVDLFGWWETSGSDEDFPVVKDTGLLDETRVAAGMQGTYTWIWNLKPITEP